MAAACDVAMENRADAVYDEEDDTDVVTDSTGEMSNWLYGNPKVLVVDDDDDTREVIVTMLERDGLRALEAQDGEIAMTLVESESPDLVILDVLMPGLDGHSVCRQLRDDLCLHDIPVIMLTGLTSLDDELEGVTSGADAYLTKPVSRRDLLARVRQFL